MDIKRILRSLLFLAIGTGLLQYCVAQVPASNNPPDSFSTGDKLFEKVEVEARFPGGDKAWNNFLVQNLDAEVPIKHKAPAGTYTVVIQFVVDRDGNVSNQKALTNHGYGMEEEVMRLLRKSPRWQPAIQDDRKVNVYRKQPVTFLVEEKKQKRKDRS
jgi:periplasmic protein TonB